MKFRVAGAVWQSRIEIDEISVEIDIVLVDPPLMCEAMWVVGMYQQQCGSSLESVLPILRQEPGLAGGSAEPFDSVCCRARYDNILGIAVAKPSDVSAKRLTIWSCHGMVELP